ncbi:MAG: hypothetical protein E4G97_07390 [Deltaproteobacteria bacterium]|nr:MAG: hypothetical protein E4G97_07390 [Deltaproteobacteria bacterium]
MSDTRGRSYSAVGDAKGMLRIGTTLTLGTNAGGAIAGTIIRVPFNCKIIGCSLYVVTGGTMGAATKILVLQSSLAGTGTADIFGTMTTGTYAAATPYELDVTETNVLAGDRIELFMVGGSSASAVVIGAAVLTYVENFVTA